MMLKIATICAGHRQSLATTTAVGATQHEHTRVCKRKHISYILFSLNASASFDMLSHNRCIAHAGQALQIRLQQPRIVNRAATCLQHQHDTGLCGQSFVAIGPALAATKASPRK